MLRQHQGSLAEAAELFEESRLEARREGDAMGEFQALEHQVVLRQQQGDWAGACRLAVELDALGGKLREGSEAPFARALVALSRHALGEAGAEDALEAALEELRRADAKLRLAHALTRAARLDLERGRPGRARARAAEARGAAEALARPTEALLAKVTLVRACRDLAEDAEAGRLLGELHAVAAVGAAVIARQEVADLLAEAARGGAAGGAGRPEEGA
jgi:hypothetical protein